MRIKRALLTLLSLCILAISWSTSAYAATDVYISVGQNTNDRRTCTADDCVTNPLLVSASGNTLTFSVPQTDPLMGLGNYVAFAGSGCLISGKVSTSVWTCTTQDGSNPAPATDATVTGISHTFPSLAGALPSSSGGAKTFLGTSDLTALDIALHVACYYDTGPDPFAVEINGWTTSVDNYIRIFTPTDITSEANSNQRHNGAWDPSKYNLDIGAGFGINVKVQHIKIDGIQIDSQDSTAASIELQTAYGPGTETFLEVSNGIMWGNNGTYASGIYIGEANLNKAYIYNNIIYDFTGTNGRGMRNRRFTESTTAYIYNNTVFNCTYGYVMNNIAGSVVLINNIAINTTDGYFDEMAYGFDPASDYNISDIADDAPGAKSRNGVSVTFVDEANDDFHLSTTDTEALNNGADLSADPNLAILTDANGQIRPAGANTDIGADEAEVKLYRSVGTNSSALASGGAISMTISRTTATFTSSIPEKIGVGDVIQYQLSGQYYMAFITSRTDNQNYAVADYKGGIPTASGGAITSWNIYRSYNSLADWHNQSPNSSIDSTVHILVNPSVDLVASRAIMMVPCYADGKDTSPVTIQNWNTSSDYFIKVYTPHLPTEAGLNQRHEGVWTSARYQLEINAQWWNTINVAVNYIDIEGLQIANVYPTSGQPNGLRISKSTLEQGRINIIGNIFTFAEGAVSPGIGIHAWDYSVDDEINIINNLVFNADDGIVLGASHKRLATYHVYNNTVVDCFDAGIVLAIEGTETGDGYFYLKNNLVEAGGNDYRFYGTGNLTTYETSNNISSDDTSPNVAFRNTTAQYLDPSSYNYHLDPSDTSARDTGTALTSFLSNDINGHLRPTGAAWDIGADEAVTQIFRSVGPAETGALDTGSGNDLTISGTLCSFTGSVPDEVGVGDIIQYDDDNDGDIDADDSIAVIHSRIDSRKYTCMSPSGQAPTPTAAADQDWSIFRAYTSLYNAERGVENTGIDADLQDFDTWSDGRDLVTNNEQWNIACYANGTTADSGRMRIEGWSTSRNNYIKIYTPDLETEVGESQRHAGIWDDWKYKLVVDDYFAAIASRADDVRIEGLQIENTATASGGSENGGIRFEGTSNSDVWISHNIVRRLVPSNTGAEAAAIMVTGDFGHDISRIYNNVTIGFYHGIDVQVWYLQTDSLETYVYNNTVYGAESTGIHLHWAWTPNVVFRLKNNLVVGSGSRDYNLRYDGSTVLDFEKNISSDDTSPNDAFDNSTIVFVDADRYDLHLDVSDTTARDAGSDLSTDLYLPITDDFTGQTRPTAGSWDIGADEGALPIYRSVGPAATSALATGSGNSLSISGSTCTFSTDLPDNVGVGDAIQYDDDNDGDIDSDDSVAFIHARSSSTVFTCKSASGEAPTATVAPDQDWSIYRAYISANNAIRGDENSGIDSDLRNFDSWQGFWPNIHDITADNEQWHIACYPGEGGAADTDEIDVGQWPTAPANYIRFFSPHLSTEVGTSQRHNGVWDDTKYRHLRSATGNYNANFRVFAAYFRAEGLQLSIQNNDYDSTRNFRMEDRYHGGNIYISHNILRGIYNSTGTDNMYAFVNNNDGVHYIYNNIAYGHVQGQWGGASMFLQDGVQYFYNNTVIGSPYGLYTVNGDVIAKNNIIISPTNGYIGSAYNSASDYNISNQASDTDSISPSYRAGLATTVIFEDAPNSNYRLAPTDAGARNQGADLSSDADLAFSDDLNNTTRPFEASWDIGADEFSDIAPPILDITAPSASDSVKGTELVSFTTNETLNSSDCSFDNTNWTACTSSSTQLSGITGWSSLSEGAFTLYLRGTDIYSNTATVTETPITKDTTAPNLAISAPTAGSVISGPEAIVFSNSEPTTPQCSINGSTWTACTSGSTAVENIAGWNAIAEGAAFSIHLRDTDSVGNSGSTSAAGYTRRRVADEDNDGLMPDEEGADPNGDGDYSDSLDTDGDGIPNYLDPDDDGDGILTIDELPDPNGDGSVADAEDTDGDGVPNYLDTDSDDDGTEDGTEVSEGSNPLDSGSVLPVMGSTICSEWNNSFGSVLSIMEHVNNSGATLKVSTALLAQDGTTMNSTQFSLGVGRQFDLVASDLIPADTEAMSFGTVCTSHDGQQGDLTARGIHYLGDSALAPHMVLPVSLQRGVSGPQHVLFNTYTPEWSAFYVSSQTLMTNWLHLINSESSTQSGTLNVYNADGSLLSTEYRTLRPLSRTDIPIHTHGSDLVGLVEWLPDNSDAKFQLRLARLCYSQQSLSYGELLFGSHTEGAVGNGEQLVVPVDGAEGVVVLEVANALTSRAIVDIHVRNAAGHLITSQAFGLRAKSTTHIILDAVLNEQKGSVTIQGNVANSIVAAAFHYRTTSDRSVVYMFGETAREALGASLSASYNTFIGQSCTMELVNSSDSAVPVEVQLYSANGSTIRPTPASAESPVSIPANGSASLDICGYCPHDNYGNAKVIPETPNTISGTLRRRGSENSYVAPIPLLP